MANIFRVIKNKKVIMLIYDNEEKMYIPYNGDYLISKDEAKTLINDLTRYLNYENIDDVNDGIRLRNKMKAEENRVLTENDYKRSISSSYLYLMESGQAIKIGISKNPEDRLKQLAIGNSDIKLIFKKLYKNAAKKEESLHKRFGNKRIYGEWYSLAKEDIDYIKGTSKNKVMKNE